MAVSNEYLMEQNARLADANEALQQAYNDCADLRDELLAALERLCEASTGDQTEAYRQQALREACAAIAKARGTNTNSEEK